MHSVKYFGINRAKSLLTSALNELAKALQHSFSSLPAVLRLVQIVRHNLTLSYPVVESHSPRLSFTAMAIFCSDPR